MIFLSDIIKDEKYPEYKEFYRLLTEENKKYNLTAILDETEFFIKNICDSIEVDSLYFSGADIIEIGSGGGFPSVPLKIKRSDLKFTLVEANQKKTEFLKNVANTFNFENFNCISARAEELSKNADHREKYDYAIARAVAPLNVLCELLLPFLKVGGYMVAYKGQNYSEELSAAEFAIKALGGKAENTINYSLDKDMGERALVIVKKIATTDEKYPRIFNQIKKKPL